MNDDDMLRRLQKLCALRDHPSTLPVIRDEAAKAYDKLYNRLYAEMNEARPGKYRRHGDIELDPMVRAIMREVNRQTRRMIFPWHIYKPRPE